MKTRQLIVGLLTDFGLADPYVGAMKAVILSRTPHVSIVDISHNVPRENAHEAGFLLWSVYRFFPKGTVFVAVVDPGVGTKRKIICAQGRGYTFLAPDNGLLKNIFAELSISRVVSVENPRYFLPQVSSTFHGRDVFAPVSSHLAAGVAPSRLGREIDPETRPEHFLTFDASRDRHVRGMIVHIDHFGNIITNIRPKNLCRREKQIRMRIGSRKIIRNSYPTFEAARTRVPFMLLGSSGLVEVAVKSGSAASLLHCRVGDSVLLEARSGQ